MTVIDKYIDNVEEPERTELKRVLGVIRSTSEDLEEVIGYGMPVFKYRGHYLIGIAAFKNHMSIFPGGEMVELLGNKLSKYKTAKGTIQFTVENPLSEALMREIIEIRLQSLTL